MGAMSKPYINWFIVLNTGKGHSKKKAEMIYINAFGVF